MRLPPQDITLHKKGSMTVKSNRRGSDGILPSPGFAAHCHTEDEADPVEQQLEAISRVPSQKLSTLIRRKNTVLRKERRKQEKEKALLKHEMEE